MSKKDKYLGLDKEALRKLIEEDHGAEGCPCCGEKTKYLGFVFFDDPCICGSGKKMKDCCYKKCP